MTIRLSFLLLLSVVIFFMAKSRHKGDGLTFFELFICGLWGFVLAHSSYGPMIMQALRAFLAGFGK